MKAGLRLYRCAALLLGCTLAHAQSAPDAGAVPASVATRLAAAREARLQGNPGSAIAELEALVRSYPEYFLARYNLGLAYAAVGRTGAAITELARARDLNLAQGLAEPTVRNSLGALYIETGQYPQARQELRASLRPEIFRKLDPHGRTVVLNNLGRLHAHLREPCDADIAYDLAKATTGALASVTPADDLSGLWLVAQWTPLVASAARGVQPRGAPRITGALIIPPNPPGGNRDGQLLLCVKQRGRAAVAVQEQLTISRRGLSVWLEGRLTAGGRWWTEDRIRIDRAGELEWAGIAEGRHSATDGRDKVVFTRVL